MLLSFERWNSEHAERDKIVLLHGLGGIGRIWRPVAASLQGHYSILAPDQRGHGKSIIKNNVDAEYTPLHFGQDLVETIESSSFHPAWIIGHSMGVRTACAFAHLKPEWTKGLVLVDFGILQDPNHRSSMTNKLVTFLKNIPMQFESHTQMRNYLLEKAPDPSFVPFLLAVATQDSRLPFDQDALVRVFDETYSDKVEDWVHEAGKNKMRILFIRGEKSQFYNEEAYKKDLAAFKKYPSFQFETIENTGHGLPFEKRKIFLEHVLKWIGAHAP